ncbi:MAG: hypothetical protein ACPHW2_07920 [Candidatus Micropelagos thuwalensis]
MDLIISAALIELATKGNPVNLQKKIGGEIVYNLETDRDVLREDEHYVPPALEINGTIYRMIAPGLTTDNFIIQTSDLIVRMDAGVSEGDNVLRVVAATPLTGVSVYDSDEEGLWRTMKNHFGIGNRN